MSVLERYKWRKVEAPRAWRPQVLPAELTGFYGGRTQRNGAFGQYDVILVHVPHQGAMLISGVKIIQLVDAAALNVGQPIRVVALPTEHITQAGYAMKQFELYVADGEAIAEEDLPQVRQ